jgi:asparagine synthase (glutamine-hydrolysing)
MTGALRHRGPDGHGRYISGPVGLGHARLSIIDIERGTQPMSNEDGTVWTVYNGEIYNFKELKRELEGLGHVFRSDSDTEVIVHLYEQYGFECVSRLQGMFAFALWDENRKTLFCARDRVGIKPLYYTDTGKSFVFGSEIKALLQDADVARDVDHRVVDTFLTFTYVPGHETMIRGIRKLPPGHFLIVRDGKVTCRQYWDLKFPESPAPRSLESAAQELRSLLQSTVRDHMISDVPVGVLLSGGVDSTAILSCAAETTNRRLQTFTVGFSGAEFADERPFAELAAQRFGTEHHAISLSADNFMKSLDSFIWHMEEPVSEPPAIALHAVSQLARRHVKVVLSGEGGDEAFAGYETYRNLLLLERLKKLLGPRVSSHLSAAVGRLAGPLSLHRLNRYARLLPVPLSSYYYSRRSSPFAFFPRSRESVYAEFLHGVQHSHPPDMIRALFEKVRDQGSLNQMLYVDTKTWLPDDLLIKADKITMANSLELRVPLLDHKVLEFAASLPPGLKVSGISTKRVLKQAFKDKLPPEILKRKKVGFPVPIRRWLQTEMKTYVHDMLLSERFIGRGYVRRGAVEDILKRFSAGEPLVHEVFSLLTLELWHQHFLDAVPASTEPSLLSA